MVSQISWYPVSNEQNLPVPTAHILSFDPKDAADNGLTGERAQQLGIEYASKNFPGHQALVCTHTDGNNESGNIHVHIVINSLRKYDVEHRGFMERSCDSRAGYKPVSYTHLDVYKRQVPPCVSWYAVS